MRYIVFLLVLVSAGTAHASTLGYALDPLTSMYLHYYGWSPETPDGFDGSVRYTLESGTVEKIANNAFSVSATFVHRDPLPSYVPSFLYGPMSMSGIFYEDKGIVTAPAVANSLETLVARSYWEIYYRRIQPLYYEFQFSTGNPYMGRDLEWGAEIYFRGTPVPEAGTLLLILAGLPALRRELARC